MCFVSRGERRAGVDQMKSPRDNGDPVNNWRDSDNWQPYPTTLIYCNIQPSNLLHLKGNAIEICKVLGMEDHRGQQSSSRVRQFYWEKLRSYWDLANCIIADNYRSCPSLASCLCPGAGSPSVGWPEWREAALGYSFLPTLITSLNEISYISFVGQTSSSSGSF